MRRRQCFRIHDNAKKESLKEYLDYMMSRFAKIAVIMDGALPHRSEIIREYAEGMGIQLIFLQRGYPHLNAWRDAGTRPRGMCLYQGFTSQEI